MTAQSQGGTQDRLLKQKIYTVSADFQRFPPQSPRCHTDLYFGPVSTPHAQNPTEKSPKLQNPENCQTPEFYNLLLSLQKSRKANVFWTFFVRVSLGFVFKAVLSLKRFLMTQTIWPVELAFPFTSPPRKKERLQYSEKLVKLICHSCCSHQSAFPHTPSLT